MVLSVAYYLWRKRRRQTLLAKGLVMSDGLAEAKRETDRGCSAGMLVDSPAQAAGAASGKASTRSTPRRVVKEALQRGGLAYKRPKVAPCLDKEISSGLSAGDTPSAAAEGAADTATTRGRMLSNVYRHGRRRVTSVAPMPIPTASAASLLDEQAPAASSKLSQLLRDRLIGHATGGAAPARLLGGQSEFSDSGGRALERARSARSKGRAARWPWSSGRARLVDELGTGDGSKDGRRTNIGAGLTQVRL